MKKKLLSKKLFNGFKKMQKQPPEVFQKKAVVKNLAIFTEKHLCWSLLLSQYIAKFLRAPILTNLRTAASENVLTISPWVQLFLILK